jgi:hypothetical protein
MTCCRVKGWAGLVTTWDIDDDDEEEEEEEEEKEEEEEEKEEESELEEEGYLKEIDVLFVSSPASSLFVSTVCCRELHNSFLAKSPHLSV